MNQNQLKSPHTLTMVALMVISALPLLGDENLFNYARSAETLPKGHFDFYQTTSLREGKDVGGYHAWDFDTELEYGFTDKFQLGIEVKQHVFNNHGVEDLREGTYYKFGGIELAAKYRFTSVFKDGYGLTFRPEIGFLRYDDVGGIIQKEFFISPNLIFQKNFCDDTLIFVANAGVELAWGKKPAEEYDKELSFQGGLGVSYRFAPSWFIGVDSRIRSEYPDFDLGNHEHTALFVGPALHYGAEKWWATLSWGSQIWGKGVGETGHRTFAEEARNEFILKIGFNF